MLKMTQQGFNRRSPAKALAHRRALGSRLSFGSSSWHQDLGAINPFSAAVTPVDNGASSSGVGDGLGLIKDLGQSMSIVEVLLMGEGRHDDAMGLGHGNRGFGAKFLFLWL